MDVVTVKLSDLATDALDRMRRIQARHLVIMEDHRVCGVISQRDISLRTAAAHPGRPVGFAIADEIPQTAGQGEPVTQLAARMVRARIGCLPVLDSEGNLMGIVTRTDIIGALLDSRTQTMGAR